MINVTIGESKAQVKPFPKMMKGTKTTLQVFFTEPNIGIVVVENANFPISYFRNTWDMCSFIDIEEAAPVVVKPFPKLMICINNSDNGTIVYFTKTGNGVIIVCGPNNFRGVGYKSDTFNMNYFTDFNESITLQNA